MKKISIQELLNDSEWDFPFFKKLANNDTGAAPGHQGGIVIPKDLRRYFPTLSGKATLERPTLDRKIKANLYIGSQLLGKFETRYQFQTWGGKRSPESRITDHLSDLRNQASGDDILLFQRNMENLDEYRLILVKKNHSLFTALEKALGSGRWGTLPDQVPMKQEDLDLAFEEELEIEKRKFVLFEENQKMTKSHSLRLARAKVFQIRVKEIYGNTCCVCRTTLKNIDGKLELDAAHIVPKKYNGSDDPRNGLALCKRHHWAFDNGLFGINGAKEIIVPDKIRKIPENSMLVELMSVRISLPKFESLQPHDEALGWHADHIMTQ